MRDQAKRREAGHPSRESLLTVWVSEAAAATDPRYGAFQEAASAEEYCCGAPRGQRGAPKLKCAGAITWFADRLVLWAKRGLATFDLSCKLNEIWWMGFEPTTSSLRTRKI